MNTLDREYLGQKSGIKRSLFLTAVLSGFILTVVDLVRDNTEKVIALVEDSEDLESLLDDSEKICQKSRDVLKNGEVIECFMEDEKGDLYEN